MCRFGNITCGGFTALNDRGYLQVSLQNAGAIAASFTVTVRSKLPHTFTWKAADELW